MASPGRMDTLCCREAVSVSAFPRPSPSQAAQLPLWGATLAPVNAGGVDQPYFATNDTVLVLVVLTLGAAAVRVHGGRRDGPHTSATSLAVTSTRAWLRLSSIWRPTAAPGWSAGEFYRVDSDVPAPTQAIGK